MLVAAAGGAIPAAAQNAAASVTAAPRVSVSVPRATARGRLAAIRLTLPTSVAAIDGRVMLA